MLEERPRGPVSFPPEGGDRYHFQTGDNWESIATANGLTAWGLIEFNFPVVRAETDLQKKSRMVNWLLHHYVGCTHSSDGMNYRFDGRDNPGVIYIPLYDQPPVYTHRVRLHFRSLSLTDVPWDRIFRATQRAYAPHGIRIDFGSGSSLGLSEDEATRLAAVNGSCEWEITTGDFAEVQRLGGSVAATDVVVYYVNRFATAGLLGCGGHLPGRPACILAASAARYSTAHEVGHVMLGSRFTPVHDPTVSNLMYAYENRTGDPPSLNAAQITQIKLSPSVIAL